MCVGYRRRGQDAPKNPVIMPAPEGPDWLHEIKFDGYRMHARPDRGTARLLTRTDAKAVSPLGARQGLPFSEALFSSGQAEAGSG